MNATPIGSAAVRRWGHDVTLIGISSMAPEALEAARDLAQEGIDAEVIDLRSLKPWDRETVLASVRKTGAAVIADPGWQTAGAAAEIAATICEEAFHYLRAPPVRITLPDAPAPANRVEEQRYYPGSAAIACAARRTVEIGARHSRRTKSIQQLQGAIA
jgi:pyruvate/2-oxoglutarate/acetoin dehydrogenase E1 component